ncbi:CGNR zinc finger domain-containing protein [Allorhizobium sp. BGMRC 0089]|uniref:CGNR zinc finger domain-containing protein n=1 Tax=Allorhizobium sonneratiae TaxID=2934936 RepID=UPI002033BC81|nr:CGNR zinc finger domain-containing protein [Allorhizobium sonneratiae]MCM2292073.1 CGNR zinc finger domain-containing protein [Allorhizobium sonneratiae]
MSFTWTPHRFAGGALALDVANSVILRFDPERSLDRFADPAQFDAFADAATEFSAERDLFGPLQPVASDNRAGFLSLREEIDRYFRARIGGETDRQRLADLLTAIAAMLRAAPSDNSLEAQTAYSALRLIDLKQPQALKICQHCGWLFLDRSKNKSRLWCDMAVCGNRVKARRHYNLQAQLRVS